MLAPADFFYEKVKAVQFQSVLFCFSQKKQKSKPTITDKKASQSVSQSTAKLKTPPCALFMLPCRIGFRTSYEKYVLRTTYYDVLRYSLTNYVPYIDIPR